MLILLHYAHAVDVTTLSPSLPIWCARAHDERSSRAVSASPMPSGHACTCTTRATRSRSSITCPTHAPTPPPHSVRFNLGILPPTSREREREFVWSAPLAVVVFLILLILLPHPLPDPSSLVCMYVPPPLRPPFFPTQRAPATQSARRPVQSPSAPARSSASCRRTSRCS